MDEVAREGGKGSLEPISVEERGLLDIEELNIDSFKVIHMPVPVSGNILACRGLKGDAGWSGAMVQLSPSPPSHRSHPCPTELVSLATQ